MSNQFWVLLCLFFFVLGILVGEYLYKYRLIRSIKFMQAKTSEVRAKLAKALGHDDPDAVMRDLNNWKNLGKKK